MKTKTLLLLTLLITLKSAGQDSLPPPYVISADTAISGLGKQHWQVLIDTNARLTIQDIKRPEISRKFIADSLPGGVGFSGLKDYWLRYRLKNNTGKDLALVFPVIIQRTDFYILRANGITQHLKTGWGVPFNEKDSFQTRNAVLVRMAKDEEIVVYKKNHLGADEFFTNFSVAGFTFYDQYVRNQFLGQQPFHGRVREALIAGLLLFAFLLNIFFFRIVREKVYLYYALTMLMEAYWFWSLGSLILVRNAPLLGYWLDLVLSNMLGYAFFIQFVRYFLKTYKYFPRWDRLIVISGIVLIVTIGSQGFVASQASRNWYRIPNLITDLFFFSTMVILGISFFFPKKERTPYLNLSIVAIFPLLAHWALVYGLINIYLHLDQRYGLPKSKLIQWLSDNASIIELFCVAWFAILFTWILLQKFSHMRRQLASQALEREKERAELMEIKNEELENKVQLRTVELKQSLDDLKNTQQQLIQSEKMASLGELTAGIAHEIQNPLNFVNNFSEVNNELLAEMKAELDKGNLSEARSIANDVVTNAEKINYHGKRADSIVKGMLQHSRSSTGIKEPTDINTITDEYLRLAYHGLRAKDKSFNATLETDYDPAAGLVNTVPQDIGRVILNLITNAFYAVAEKKKNSAPGSYEPTVRVGTKLVLLENNRKAVDIRIRDNGNGISKKIADKIFQPFFTTKPTGQGTGLGLSMSYDIVVNAHDGMLSVESVEGEYAEFFIQLPA
jgi:two-component system NtrC family sensor kinase